MAGSERDFEVRVSAPELRSALAAGGARPRRLPPQPRDGGAGAAGWDWSADERSQAELAELRAALAAERERVAELERDAARAQERERELHDALRGLAAAGSRQRRRLTAELRGRALL